MCKPLISILMYIILLCLCKGPVEAYLSNSSKNYQPGKCFANEFEIDCIISHGPNKFCAQSMSIVLGSYELLVRLTSLLRVRVNAMDRKYGLKDNLSN